MLAIVRFGVFKDFYFANIHTNSWWKHWDWWCWCWTWAAVVFLPGLSKPTAEWLFSDSSLLPGKGKNSIHHWWHLEVQREVTSQVQLCLGADPELGNEYLLSIWLLWAPFSHLMWDFGRLVITVVCILESPSITLWATSVTVKPAHVVVMALGRYIAAQLKGKIPAQDIKLFNFDDHIDYLWTESFQPKCISLSVLWIKQAVGKFEIFPHLPGRSV